MPMNTWTAVDDVFAASLLEPDPILEGALRASDAAGLPAISVSAAQGKYLYLQALSLRATRILEVGTLGGYSAIWMARALGDEGRLTTLEAEPRHAEVARANIAAAGLQDRVEVIVGRAIETLPTLEDRAPFDLVFIDADKPSNADYFDWAVRLGHPGTVIIVDNVVRDGAIADPTNAEASVEGVRRLNKAVEAQPRVSATVVQTVGAKGYDGFMYCVVVS
ncbi:predicted O-methyltransferase YrrM [Jatrophihabitans sp. GAS493]|uniref:O-methyltransferase n=1 Tax=Jatrophihabitans sp. GAS493 TaxID=1907575 RepID=UPI000BB68756|nr:O-methyltransferase [Jatrophihabitans sp. GAS493]SOD73836.1 predicted O-methyltransferase YrrM [Jatrophihabitans sp. GAS493]